MSNNYTPHIKANPEDFAKTVLMPGDPKRSKFVAETFLDSPRLVNDVRGVQGYTGTYKGTPVTVMASGMGMPSIGIYSYELFNFFGVDNIIRIGSCGALGDDVKLRDVVIGMGASYDSRFAEQYGLGGIYAPIASYDMVELAVAEAKALGVSYKVGSLLSTDVFYNVTPDYNLKWKRMGILGVEMEAAALYMNAAYLNKRALAICTVSDHILRGESLDSDARATSFTDMMKIALETAIKIQGK
ncbi:MAG: purine-nucleoside phosphorylase [Clostridia bacterium]|nr:purine-nucleoside phosphorylase [Clostridia bacterium]